MFALIMAAAMLLTGVGMASASLITFTTDPVGSVVVGQPLKVHCQGDSGTTRLEITGAIKTDPAFNEFGGPDNNAFLKTEEWGVGSLTIVCAIRHGNDWIGAERYSLTVQITNAEGSGSVSNNSGNTASGQPYILPSESRVGQGGVDGNIYCAGLQLGAPSGNSNDGSLHCGSTPISWASVCTNVWGGSAWENTPSGIHCFGTDSQNIPHAQGNPCQVTALVTKGESAMILPGVSNNLRDSASTSGKLLASIPGGSILSILDGPTCAGDHRWWKVNFNGTIGWTADGDNNEYWMQGIGNGQPEDQSAPSNINYTFSFGGVNYPVNFNPDDCHIVNGPDIIAKEIEWFSNWASQYPDIITRDINVAKYLNVNSGTIEQLRISFQQDLIAKSENRCNSDRLKYEVGDREMDMSGLGNLMYGYYLGGYNENIGAFVANVAQAFNKDTPYQYGDNPDDITQRATGEAIVKAIGFNVTPTPKLVVQMADQNNLF